MAKVHPGTTHSYRSASINQSTVNTTRAMRRSSQSCCSRDGIGLLSEQTAFLLKIIIVYLLDARSMNEWPC
eukprot:2999613-Amphidinium_carterae.1